MVLAGTPTGPGRGAGAGVDELAVLPFEAAVSAAGERFVVGGEHPFSSRVSSSSGRPSIVTEPCGLPWPSVEPVDINAGGYYLRMLRADDRVDDRPAVLAAFADPDTARWIPEYKVRTIYEAADYIALREKEWLADERCSWAVAEPSTGQLLAEVGLKNLNFDRSEAAIACWTHPAHRGRGIAVHAVCTALRFGFDALGLQRIEYWYADGNEASARVAAKCGFSTLLGVLRGATEVDGEQRDLLCFARHAEQP